MKLPQGGGAIKGLGDSFKANLFSGAGTYSIPLPTTPARGFEPALSLSYSSGAGNGPFGLGFALSLSRVSINTGLRIPRYAGKDEFQLDGTSLAVKEESAGSPNPRVERLDGVNYVVTAYLTTPVINYSQIERWLDEATGVCFWKTMSTSNVCSWYGIDENSRIADPEKADHISEWLINHTLDSKGNMVRYNYVRENNDNVPAEVFELDRDWRANRYISTVDYGNYFTKDGKEEFAFRMVFNYGEDGTHTWPCRPDPFSFYHSGFEVRTFRRCQKIQLVHRFPDELGNDLVVKEMSLEYENVQAYTPVKFQGPSLLRTILFKGYRQELSEPQSLPPLQFNYSSFRPPVAPSFQPLEIDQGTVPGYLDEEVFLPVDLNGEGLPGLLFCNNNISLYMEPLGDGKYQAPVANGYFPIFKDLKADGAFLADINGDGSLELVVDSGNAIGFYPRDKEGEWRNYKTFESLPNDYQHPLMESVDLDADGQTDLLLPGRDSLRVYPSKGENGYSGPVYVTNDNGFPLAKEGGKQELVSYADVFGDGLSHRIRVRDGSVEAWPCLGYGRFGKKVVLGNAPRYGEDFDATRIYLADVDGSGTSLRAVSCPYPYPSIALFSPPTPPTQMGYRSFPTPRPNNREYKAYCSNTVAGCLKAHIRNCPAIVLHPAP